jgi:hypothetical protein
MAAWLLDHGADPNTRAATDAEGFGGHTLCSTLSFLSAAAETRRQPYCWIEGRTLASAPHFGSSSWIWETKTESG